MCRPLLTVFFLLAITVVVGQDIIVRTNGAQLSVKVVEITEDSVYYKNKAASGNLLFSLSRNDVKVIEYWNGKKDYLQGSYSNKSMEDSSTLVTGIKSKEQNVSLYGIQFRLDRLFTEYHLQMNYTYHPDTNFIASKGKIEFVFENSRDNFFVKYFPTGEKTTFVKFQFNETGKNKRFDKLTNDLLLGMIIYYDDSVSELSFDEEQASELKELFSGKDIRYEP